MEITFDLAKDKVNKKKHGISLSRAVKFDLNAAVYEIDDSQDYGEVRYLALSFLDGRLHSLTFTLVDDKLRAISLRKATRDEENRYRQAH